MLYKIRLHHLAVVGNGIVEGERLQRSKQNSIAITHRGKCVRRPNGICRRVYDRCSLSLYIQIELLSNPHTLDSVYKALRILLIIKDSKLCKGNIGGVLKSALNSGETAVVRVCDGLCKIGPSSSRCIHRGIKSYQPILQKCGKCNGLEGGTGLCCLSYGVIVYLLIFAVPVVPKIYNCPYCACLDLHNHCSCPLNVRVLYTPLEGSLRRLLQVYIYGCLNVVTIYRFYVLRAVYRSEPVPWHSLEHLLALGALKVEVEASLQTGASAGVCHKTYGNSGKP